MSHGQNRGKDLYHLYERPGDTHDSALYRAPDKHALPSFFALATHESTPSYFKSWSSFDHDVRYDNLSIDDSPDQFHQSQQGRDFGLRHWDTRGLDHRVSDSTYSSDCSSERHSSMIGSPLQHIMSYPPGPAYGYDDHYLRSTGLSTFEPDDVLIGTSYVAMGQIQPHADTQPDPVVYRDEQTQYTDFATPEEGFTRFYQQVEPYIEERRALEATHISHFPAHLDETTLERRRVDSRRSSPSPQIKPVKVTKRPSARRLTASRTNIARQHGFSDRMNPHPSPQRAFLCPLIPYGCTSSFSAKNEWKRHIYTQHLRLGYWRCKQCPPGKHNSTNDFNRKDLFVQHLRRMHSASPSRKISPRRPTQRKKSTRKVIKTEPGPRDEDFNAIAEASYHALREAPEYSACLFCPSRFSGERGFEERLEHIGKHMENMRKGTEAAVAIREWNRDEAVEDWMLSEGLEPDLEERGSG